MNSYAHPHSSDPERLPCASAHPLTSSPEGGSIATGADTPPGVPAPGGEAAPLLDIGCGNVPQNTGRQPWTRQQWLIRRSVLDRLNAWQARGYQCLWVTLTSSPASSADLLRKHFQTLRKRIARQLGYERIEYVCVDTREGHGVLHTILAWKEPS